MHLEGSQGNRMLRSMRLLLLATTLASVLNGSTAQRLFFTEYWEFQAVEIFNPSCQAVDLSEYEIRCVSSKGCLSDAT